MGSYNSVDQRARGAAAVLRSGSEERRSFPLSREQRQIWLHAQFAESLPLYNQIFVLERDGTLDHDLLERSLSDTVERHEILRATFHANGTVPAQVISSSQSPSIQRAQIASATQPQRDRETLKILNEEIRRPFDLSRGPLLRARVLQFGSTHSLIILVAHAIVADDFSLQSLACELTSVYDAYSHGRGLPSNDPQKQYWEYVDQQLRSENERAADPISYWREQLADVPPVIELPTDRPRPPLQRFVGASFYRPIPKNLSEGVEALSQQCQFTPYDFYLAAFEALLFRYTGQEDCVVGSVFSGRDADKFEDLVGPLAHTLVIRTNLVGDPNFRQLLERVHNVVLAAREHESISFDRLVDELQPERDASRNPLFQVLFSYEKLQTNFASGWRLADLNADSGTANVDLQLEVRVEGGRAAASFVYNTDLYDEDSIHRMADHFEVLLEGALLDPEQTISRLPLLKASERQLVVGEWNKTHAPYPRELCVHQLFEEQARRTPDAVAVVFENQQLTYRELNRRANQLARHLTKMGVGRESLVGVCVDRSLEMVVSLLGVLKAGGAYVPLDPAFPRDRLAFMLEDAEAPVVITQRHLSAILPDTKARLLYIDTGWPEIAKEGTDDLPPSSGPENLMYVIYTSGSTGKPKGVQVLHRGVVNFLVSMSEKPGLNAHDQVFSVTTLSFDIAGLEIYLPLILGASVEIVSREIAADGNQLFSKLRRSSATVMQATPATFRMLMEAGWQGDSRLKVLCGGEAISQKLAGQLVERSGSVWNMYGPTETTIWSTVGKIESGEQPVFIGKPINNTQIFVLDKLLQPVPIGVAGELHIGGDGLARGYLKRPELTAEKFIASPFSKDAAVRLYKTGDLARYRPSGDIEFLGRIDHQVKIRGFRIELGEVESALRQHPGVNETVVIDREDTPGDKRLVAYLVPVGENPPTAAELRAFLKERLPEYMVPSVFANLDRMPLTPNGKVNRRALPVPEKSDLTPSEDYAAPRNEIESGLIRIWEDLLGVRPIGIRDNFFELGGHSLLAVRMMQKIAQEFATTIPVSALFQSSNVERLAILVREKESAPQWTSLVPIQVADSRTAPFFCVHGAGGVIIRFRDLARYLGSEQSVYGLQAQGVNENYPCHDSVEEMAAHYIQEIRSVQAHGPYYLGGYSFGGTVALEIAQQLRLQGEETAILVLFDTFCVASGGKQISGNGASLGDKLSAAASMLWSSDRKGSQLLHTGKLLHAGIQRRWSHMRVPKHLKAVRHACEQAGGRYVPRPYSGKVVLFRSSQVPLGVNDPYQGWNQFFENGMDVHEITCDHDNILLEPQVRMVAQALKNMLREQARQAETLRSA